MIPKFRAWDKESQTMLDVSLMDFKKSVLVGEHWKFGETNFMSFDDIKLMQTTGLFDKNGTEIFEGDALKNNDYPNQTFICKHSRLQASFQAESLNGLLTLSLWKDEERDWQVLGNIYENPELVEAEHDIE